MNLPPSSGHLLPCIALALTACATAPKNVALERFDDSAGYRIENVVADEAAKHTYVILSFSGGGTRAAALAYGVLEKLRDTGIADGRTLLDEVDVMSSVSGGSFTAAYYALHGKDAFATFPDRFLYQDVQGTLFWKLFNPVNLYRLASGTFNRIDMAAEYYDEAIFDGATFADLLAGRDRPFAMINATDMTLGSRFEFTQDQFDLIYSDLSKFPVARAVAASSAFPVLLSPIRLVNPVAGEDFQAPAWIANGLENPVDNAAAYNRARNAQSYYARDETDKLRPFLHLVDGGISDNIGLRGPLIAATTTRGGAWCLLNDINNGLVKRLIVIAVDAKTDPASDYDRSESAPSVVDVLGAAATKPMDNYSSETIEAMRESFKISKMLADTRDACEQIVREYKPDFSLPEMPRADLHFVHVSFEHIADEKLRTELLNMPTSFTLKREQVDLLRRVAGELLDQSEEFANIKDALNGG